jgi:hypothetical protein
MSIFPKSATCVNIVRPAVGIVAVFSGIMWF